MTNYILYKHTFPNGKLYFGITSRPVEERWRKDGSGYKKNPSMWRAIKKYGWENVKHEILFEGLSEQEANKKEIELIASYHTTDRQFGYNIMPGGLVSSGWHHTDEAKEKMSKALTGHKGVVPWNKGKHYGKQKVYQYSIDGEFIQEFENTYVAAEKLNIPACNIFDNINLHSKSCYGYIFAKEYLAKEIILKLYLAEPGAHRVTIYQYDHTGQLIQVFRSYKAVMECLNICESCLENCLSGRQKTANNYVFSKTLLTVEEVTKHYIVKKRKTKYKFLLINKETGSETLYNTIEDMANALQIKPTVLRNVVNGAYSKLTKRYKFERILNNEN